MVSAERRLALAVGDTSFEVDPQAGGRITSFRRGDAEVLVGPAVHPKNWGSTLWTSPQSAWGWPPPAEFDDMPYEVVSRADGIELLGPPNEALGVSLTKRFSVDARRDSVALEYGIRNVASRPVTAAAWEVSRVPPGGLTFYPAGATAGGALRLDRIGDGSWYRHDPSGLTEEGAKSFADGTGGFVAHVVGRLLFVKAFSDLPPRSQAPGEGEVEIHANDRYVEVEVQGPYVRIEPGEVALWPVRWFLREIPPNMSLTAGSDELMSFAAQVAGGHDVT